MARVNLPLIETFFFLSAALIDLGVDSSPTIATVYKVLKQTIKLQLRILALFCFLLTYPTQNVLYLHALLHTNNHEQP